MENLTTTQTHESVPDIYGEYLIGSLCILNVRVIELWEFPVLQWRDIVALRVLVEGWGWHGTSISVETTVSLSEHSSSCRSWSTHVADAVAVLWPRFEISAGVDRCTEDRWGEMAPVTREAEKCLRFETSCLWLGRVRRALLVGLNGIIFDHGR